MANNAIYTNVKDEYSMSITFDPVFFKEIYRWSLDSSHKGPVMRKVFALNDANTISDMSKTTLHCCKFSSLRQCSVHLKLRSHPLSLITWRCMHAVVISVGHCKEDATPVRQQWSYVFLALTHLFGNCAPIDWNNHMLYYFFIQEMRTCLPSLTAW